MQNVPALWGAGSGTSNKYFMRTLTLTDSQYNSDLSHYTTALEARLPNSMHVGKGVCLTAPAQNTG